MFNSLARENISPVKYEQLFFGKWVAQCAVHTKSGEHCPDAPEHTVEYNGKKVGLCKRCFTNYQNGEFSRQKRYADDRLYIG